MPERMLDVSQVAARCAVSTDTIRRDIRLGLLDAIDLGAPGGRPLYRIPEPWVAAYLERRKRIAPASSEIRTGKNDLEDGLERR